MPSSRPCCTFCQLPEHNRRTCVRFHTKKVAEMKAALYDEMELLEKVTAKHFQVYGEKNIERKDHDTDSGSYEIVASDDEQKNKDDPKKKGGTSSRQSTKS